MSDARVSDLDWGNPESAQIRAVRSIIEDHGISPFLLLQDKLPKSSWLNAAIVLRSWGSPRIDVIIDGLLLWLQDLNWPGATHILVLLYDMPTGKLSDPLLRAIQEAKERKDEDWLYNLSFLVDREEHEARMRCSLIALQKLTIESAMDGIE